MDKTTHRSPLKCHARRGPCAPPRRETAARAPSRAPRGTRDASRAASVGTPDASRRTWRSSQSPSHYPGASSRRFPRQCPRGALAALAAALAENGDGAGAHGAALKRMGMATRREGWQREVGENGDGWVPPRQRGWGEMRMGGWREGHELLGRGRAPGSQISKTQNSILVTATKF